MRFGERRGLEDSFLSTELGSVRRLLGSSLEADSVLAAPQCDDYHPRIYSDGAMQLGAGGVEDFEATFGPAEIDTNHLLVVYEGARMALHARREDIHDGLHEALGRVAAFCIREKKLPKRLQDRHGAEGTLIGYAAARLAQKRVAETSHTTPAEKLHKPAKIMFAAENRLRRGANRYGAEGKLVMEHFNLGLPTVEEDLFDVILKTRSRSPAPKSLSTIRGRL